MARTGKIGKKKPKSNGKKKTRAPRRSQPNFEESVDPEAIGHAEEIGSDDEAPEEMPVDKVGAGFIPLTKRKKGRKTKKTELVAVAGEVEGEDDGQSVEQAVPTRPQRTKRFLERSPGHYFGLEKNKKFHIIDLSTDGNNPTSSHRRAADLKRKMFSRHRRITGTQLVGQLQKSKMIGKG